MYTIKQTNKTENLFRFIMKLFKEFNFLLTLPMAISQSLKFKVGSCTAQNLIYE